MSEQVLKAFRLGPDLYRLGQYSPVSVRDQIVRAHYLVHALFAEGLLQASSSLAIVGAGAAGTAAAIVAAELGVADVHLVEVADNALSLQGKATNRWLDPVQYDWPAHHWTEGVWPIHDAGRSLTAQAFAFPQIGAGAAPRIAAFLQNRLAAWLGASITPHWETTLLAAPTASSGRGRLLDLQEEGAPRVQLQADVAILAMGFGRERSSAPHRSAGSAAFEGIEFWDPDTFEDANFGMSAVPHGVLVSGSGDGALQDFIRLATGRRSVKAVVNPVLAMMPASFVREAADVWQWEEMAALQRAVVPLPIDECELLRRIHRRYEGLVDAIVAAPQWPLISSLLDGMVTGRPADQIRLAVKADHFSGCYPLNRLGALLVARFIAQKWGTHPILYDTGLKSTFPVGHACAAKCWGQPHEVCLALGAGCDTPPADVASWPAASCDTRTFDGLVIRHGIDPSVYFGSVKTSGKLSPMASPRHLP